MTLAIPLHKSGFRFRAVLDFKNPYLRTAIKMVPPIMVGSWLSPMTILIGKHFASYFNGVATFNYANQTYIMIAGILVYSICNYVFPTLSRLAGAGQEKAFTATVRSGAKCAMFIVVPCMFAVIVLAGEIVAILYLRGEYTAQNAADTAEALRVIALAMPAYAVIEIVSRVFYSKQKTLFPMLASAVGVAAILAVSAVCVLGFHQQLRSVAAAVAAGQALSALVLLISAGVTIKGLYTKPFVLDMVKITLSGLLSFAAMTALYRVIGRQPFEASLLRNFIVCVLTFGCGAVVYLAGAWLMKLKISLKRGKE